MAFVLTDKKTVKWPVKYNVPKDGGKVETVEFLGEFLRLPQSRLDEIFVAAKKDEIDDQSLVDEVFVGWSGIKQPVEDENNKVQLQEFPFSESNRAILLDYPGMRAAIVNAFFDSVNGASRKN